MLDINNIRALLTAARIQLDKLEDGNPFYANLELAVWNLEKISKTYEVCIQADRQYPEQFDFHDVLEAAR